MIRTSFVAILVVSLASAAYAQMYYGKPQPQPQGYMYEMMKKKMNTGQTGQHVGHDNIPAAGHATAGPRGDDGPSSAAFHAINKKMHKGMSITFTGDADRDFVNGMIPHHLGAVEMAKVVLAFGADPDIRKLAEEIIRAQQSEIALMRAWLERNPLKPEGDTVPHSYSTPHSHR